MAFSEQIDQLIARLADLTENGKVAWEETADEGIFLASVGRYVVTLGKENRQDSWGDSYESLRFRILDGTGKTIDEASSYGQTAEDSRRLYGLYELARRSALHVDEALSDLLSSLEHI